MNTPNNHLTPPQSTPPQNRDFESRITTAIEQKPEPRVPADFAAKVAARAVAQPLRRRRYKPQFGRMIALVSALVAALALFVLAPHTAPSVKSLSFDTEVVLLAELAFIGWWLARAFNQQMSR